MSQRGIAVTPDEFRRRWNDERIDDLAAQLKMLAPIVTQVARHDIQIETIGEDFAEIKSMVGDVRKTLREDSESRAKNRVYIAAAVIAGSCTVLASLMTAVVRI